jgi:hypothetical protein
MQTLLEPATRHTVDDHRVTYLLALDNEAFTTYVATHLGPEHAEPWKALASPLLAARSRKALGEMLARLNAEICQRRAAAVTAKQKRLFAPWHRKAAAAVTQIHLRCRELGKVRTRRAVPGPAPATARPQSACPGCSCDGLEWVGGPGKRQGATCVNCGWSSSRAQDGTLSTRDALVAEWTAVIAGKSRFRGPESGFGTSQFVALILVILELDIVTRPTVTALLDATQTAATKATVTRALRGFAWCGWIRRLQEPEGAIEVVDRDALAAWVNAGAPDVDEMFRMLNVGRVATNIAESAALAGAEVRARELRALRRLMETGIGVGVFERGSVALVCKPELL